MRYLLAAIALCVTLSTAMAQEAWVQLSASEQQQVLRSRHTPEVARRALSDIDALSAAEHDELWLYITSPTRREGHDALRLHLYELLRPQDGSAAVKDATMLAAYPEYMLRRLAQPINRDEIYNYAYGLGRYEAITGSHRNTAMALRKLRKRRYRKHYAAEVELLRRSIVIAKESVALGMGRCADITPPSPIDNGIDRVSRESFLMAESSYSLPKMCTTYRDEEQRRAAEECMTFDAAYYHPTPHTMGRNITLIHAAESDGGHYLLIDNAGTCHTLPSALYILGDGTLLAVERGTEESYVLRARLIKGRLHVEGRVTLPYGATIREMRCNDQGLYLHVEGEAGEEYLYINRA